MHERRVSYIGNISCPNCGGFNTGLRGGDNDGSRYYKCSDCGCSWEEYGLPIVRRVIR